MNDISMAIRFLVTSFGAVLFMYTIFSDTPRKGSLAVGFSTIGVVTIIFYDKLSALFGGGTAINTILLVVLILGSGLGIYHPITYQRERASEFNSSL